MPTTSDIRHLALMNCDGQDAGQGPVLSLNDTRLAEVGSEPPVALRYASNIVAKASCLWHHGQQFEATC